MAVTLKAAPLPFGVVAFAGWPVIAGSEATVSVAQLVTVLHAPVTRTQ